MRTLSGPMNTAVAASLTTPGYLVSIAFSPVLYMSSRGAFTWNSQSWLAFDVDISGLNIDGSSSNQNGSIIVGNADLAIGVLVLGQGVSGKAISVWKFYGEAPGATDPVKIFEGVGNDVEIPDYGPVKISVQQSGGATLYCPRTYMTKANGFNWLPADGSIVAWNGESVRLTPEGY